MEDRVPRRRASVADCRASANASRRRRGLDKVAVCSAPDPGRARCALALDATFRPSPDGVPAAGVSDASAVSDGTVAMACVAALFPAASTFFGAAGSGRRAIVTGARADVRASADCLPDASSRCSLRWVSVCGAVEATGSGRDALLGVAVSIFALEAHADSPADSVKARNALVARRTAPECFVPLLTVKHAPNRYNSTEPPTTWPSPPGVHDPTCTAPTTSATVFRLRSPQTESERTSRQVTPVELGSPQLCAAPSARGRSVLPASRMAERAVSSALGAVVRRR